MRKQAQGFQSALHNSSLEHNNVQAQFGTNVEGGNAQVEKNKEKGCGAEHNSTWGLD